MTEQELKKRIAAERRAIRQAVRIAKKHGWKPIRVWDGEENVPTKTESAVMDAVFSVDESTIRFEHAVHKGKHCLCVVLGNSGSECIYDASQGEGWDPVVEEVFAHLETLEA